MNIHLNVARVLGGADVRVSGARRGFAALMSVIMISALLAAVVLSAGLTGRSALDGSLEAEYELRSEMLAVACVERALLDAARGDLRVGDVVVDAATERPDSCSVMEVGSSSGRHVILVRGEYPPSDAMGVVTDLRIEVDPSDLSIVSWRKMPACRSRSPPDGSCD